MASTPQPRHIYLFLTAAGTSFGTHGGGNHVPFPKFMKHWGVMVASGKDDQSGIMIELDKRGFLDELKEAPISRLRELRETRSLKSKIWPKIQTRTERETAEWLIGNYKIKIKETGFTTTYTNAQLREAAQKACDMMFGEYDLFDYNCQTMATKVINSIKSEDGYFDRTQLEILPEGVSLAVELIGDGFSFLKEKLKG